MPTNDPSIFNTGRPCPHPSLEGRGITQRPKNYLKIGQKMKEKFEL
jgi:hypothetical protein